MGKYLQWILKERNLAPLSNVVVCNSAGHIRRRIQNTYECPYCHKTYKCIMSNEFNIRKCRFCSHPVSPYKGDITSEIWLPEGIETLDQSTSKEVIT